MLKIPGHVVSGYVIIWKMKITKIQKNKSFYFFALSVLAVMLVGYIVYAYINHSWPFPKNTTQTTSTDQSTIDSSIEDSVRGGSGSGQGNADAANGGVVDTKGEAKPTGEGVSSASGDITLYSPIPDQSINDSIVVSGTANSKTVYYRISDNLRGMIGNGQLEVVRGSFSGNLSVTTSAEYGYFEVYTFNDAGQEINNVSVKVTY